MNGAQLLLLSAIRMTGPPARLFSDGSRPGNDQQLLLTRSRGDVSHPNPMRSSVPLLPVSTEARGEPQTRKDRSQGAACEQRLCFVIRRTVSHKDFLSEADSAGYEQKIQRFKRQRIGDIETLLCGQ